MRKGDIELLAPAGSYEALVAAVQSGANAIYVGGLQFGARAFANNFDNETMKKAVEYCHLHDVLLYVTVNTLYSDEQFNELIEYITFLYCIGIDAFIVQDMGLFHLIKKYFPDIEIHMSTQASIKNLEGVKYFEKQNVDRVVLAREMNIQEISTIANQCDIDLEVFVHGAICMSYSGQCLMSSMLSKRSGNKGKCSQPCRLSYSLLEDGNLLTENQYLLSPQDLC
ncbi:MAG: peptidase U32 family protein, partial [Faecalibacillus sp.]